MARKPKQPFTMESNLDQIIEKIHEKPYTVMNKIGAALVKEIKPNIPKKTGRLRKSIGYWARKEQKDIQIGFYTNKKIGKDWSAFYSSILFGRQNDPIKAAVLKNAELIQRLIGEALDEIRKE